MQPASPRRAEALAFTTLRQKSSQGCPRSSPPARHSHPILTTTAGHAWLFPVAASLLLCSDHCAARFPQQGPGEPYWREEWQCSQEEITALKPKDSSSKESTSLHCGQEAIFHNPSSGMSGPTFPVGASPHALHASFNKGLTLLPVVTAARRNGDLSLSMGQMQCMWSVYGGMVKGASTRDRTHSAAIWIILHSPMSDHYIYFIQNGKN